jgi:hypothetical protein
MNAVIAKYLKAHPYYTVKYWYDDTGFYVVVAEPGTRTVGRRLDDALAELTLKLKALKDCPACDGLGHMADNSYDPHVCASCAGTGTL